MASGTRLSRDLAADAGSCLMPHPSQTRVAAIVVAPMSPLWLVLDSLKCVLHFLHVWFPPEIFSIVFAGLNHARSDGANHNIEEGNISAQLPQPAIAAGTTATHSVLFLAPQIQTVPGFCGLADSEDGRMTSNCECFAHFAPWSSLEPFGSVSPCIFVKTQLKSRWSVKGLHQNHPHGRANGNRMHGFPCRTTGANAAALNEHRGRGIACHLNLVTWELGE